MLTFRQLEDAGAAAAQIMAETEDALIRDMARRIGSLGGVTGATNWQALRLELLGTEQEKIVRELSRALSASEARIFEMFDEAAARALDADGRMYRAAGYSPVPLAENAYLRQVLRAGLLRTGDTYMNLTATTALTATGQFGHALDLAYQKIVSGGFTYQQAIKEGIRSLTADGLASVTYPTGHVDYLDVAFRRATLTGVNQTCAEMQLANMRQMGTDLVETTAHPGARPDHMPWQGKVFSVGGKDPGYPDFREATGYGTGAGLCGWNCRHSFFPFFEGLSDPAYTADKLREYNSGTVKYDGKEMSQYDAAQRQRAIERQIRKWKREEGALEAAGLDSSAARAKVREWQARQRDFIDQTGLKRDYFRERAGKQNRAGSSGVAAREYLDTPAGRATEVAKIDNLTYDKAVELLAKYEDEIRGQLHETAYVITRDGRVLKIDGTEQAVNIGVVGDLRGAFVTHNHPTDYTEYTFSKDDLNTFVENRLELLRGTDYKYTYEMSRTGEVIKPKPLITSEANEETYQHSQFAEKAYESGIPYRRWTK